MARSFKKLIKWIKDRLAEQVTAEGGVLFMEVDVEGKTYKFQFTAEGGFFTVLVKPPAGRDPTVRDVLLVFSFRDLYLLGLFRGGLWRLYDDAYLEGSGATDLNKGIYWDELGFQGGYFQRMRGLHVGLEPMYHALHTLCNPNSSNLEVRLALYQFLVGIPEAIRFLQWLRRYLALLRDYQPEALANNLYDFDLYFSTWSTLCKRIRRGGEAFLPGDGFNTYKDLAQAVFLLLSRPPQNQL